MAQKVLEFTIHLTNKAECDALQTAYPGGIHLAPDTAALTYLAPKQNVATLFSAPCVRSPYFVVDGSNNYPTNVASFTRKSGGWFGLSFLFGTTTVFKWVGLFVYSASGTGEIGGVPTEVVAIAKRKWIVGFETPLGGDNPSPTPDQMQISRDASRHIDGYGWSNRGSADEISVTTTAFGVAANTKTWERFYFRIRKMPTAETRFWYCHNGNGAFPGATLNITPDGHISIHNVDSAGTETLQATTADTFVVGQWYRADILLEMKNPGGNLRLWIGRKLLSTVTFAAGVGMSLTGNHVSSLLGYNGANDLEMDMDDWVGADWPTPDSGGRFTGIDWLNGSKIQGVRAKAVAAANNYLGDYRHVNAQFGESNGTGMTTTVATDTLALTMNDGRAVQLGAIGCVCFEVGILLTPTGSIGGTVGTLGWFFNAALDLAALSPAQIGNTQQWHTRLYNPTGLTAPIANLFPLELRHVHSSAATTETCFNAAANLELVGIFGAEDIPADVLEPVQPDAYPPRNGLHMAPYPRTPWAMARTQPISPVVTHSGQYTGNGTVTELQFRTAPTWICIRRQTSATLGSGAFWFSSLLSIHPSGQNSPIGSFVALADPNYAPTGVEDTQEQNFLVRITGALATLNSAAVVYNYVAFCDPGARFSLSGGLHHRAASVNGVANALQNALFTPDYTFLQRYRVVNGDATVGLYVRGPGHTTDKASQVSAAEAASVLTTAAGLLNSGTTVQVNDSPVGFQVWRNDDGSADPNKLKVVKILTYTGDGAASRTLGLGVTGLRPLLAIITPHNGASYIRTPSHTGVNSTNMSTSNEVATAITGGGVDAISLGTTLNANTIVYELFVLFGSATAGNGGWSIDGEFSVIDPDSTSQGGAPDTSLEPIDTGGGGVDPDPNQGPDDTNDCADGAVCVAATTRIVNLALLEIGVDKILTNYCTEETRQAVLARTIYEQCVRHTLITYPWPFATKYARLTLAATQPVNADWTYSYRIPVDCIFPRRLVVSRGTAPDPTPPPFMMSSDDSGGLLFANEATPDLEYTARPGCVGYNGDDLFIEALKWRIAAALAPPLTRIAGEAERCMKMFEIIIQKAESTIKPGVPGARPAASTLDTTVAALAANVQVVNSALVRIGAKTIANLTSEQSREAITAALVFEDTLRSVLRDHPWAFATRYLDPAVLVSGAASAPVNVDWTYAHRLPTDLVMLRRLALEGTGRSFEEEPFEFRLSSDATGGLLFSNELEPLIEYTARIQNILVFADPVFRDALAWRLAATMAPSLAEVNPYNPEQHGRGPETPQDPTRRDSINAGKHARRLNAAQWAWGMYYKTLPRARELDANEQKQEPNPDAEWIRDRS